ncbi:MAG: hypothetical protein H0Z33_13265 [Bacillaceae bacterium]|nr:hypothetical protein [Bacillaceae bacterium]
MLLSECCGAPTRVEYRTDHPFVYDDPYDLEIPIRICTCCGSIVGLHEPEADEREP